MIFELIDFIDSDHQYVFLISFSTKSKLVEITLHQIKSSTSADVKRIRTISEASELSRLWSLEWITNKSLFKKTVKQFERSFLELVDRQINENSLNEMKQSRHFSDMSANQSEQDTIDQKSFNSSSNEFSSAQFADLSRLIAQIMNNRQSHTNASAQTSQQLSDVFDHRQTKDWFVEKIEFFDSIAESIDSIINVEKHIFYRDVYAFTDRLKDMTTLKNDIKLRTVISQCLRESTFIWHSIELFVLKKKMLKDASLINWYNALIRRFKKRTSVTLTIMQIIKYTMKNAKQHKNSRMFAQNLFRAVKAVNLISTHNQLTIAWNNLIWQFRQHISKSTEQTIMREFLEQLDSQISIWHEMTTLAQSAFRKSNKLFFQYQSDKIIERYRDDRSYRNNNAYQNSRQKQSDRSLKVKIIIKIETSNDRNDKNWRNKSNDKRDRYRDKNRYRNKDEIDKDFKNIDKEKFKTKTYMTQNEQKINDDYEKYHDSDNLNYFDSDYDEKNENIDVTVSLTIISRITCRRCKLTLQSNNALHKHLKTCVAKIDANALHIAFKKSSSIKCSNVDANKNIDIDYEFKDYQYAFAKISLIENENSTSVCADIEAEITFVDTMFFNTTAKNISIRTMITSITVRELNTTKHFIDKYVIVFMYFSEKNNNDELVRAKITRKVHLIDNLKANMLIENDVLRSKKFDIFTFTSTVYIESCEIIISIFIKNRFTSKSAAIHSIKARIISSHTEISISIHKISLSERDYFFEPVEANFSIYSHVVDTAINVVLVRNNNVESIKIFKNFRLSKLIEIEHFNVFHVKSKSSDLAIRILKSKHKKLFLDKILRSTVHKKSDAFLATIKNTNVVLSNDITIHNSSEGNVIQKFSNLIEKYSSLWTNQKFANLSKDNWMRLSLRSNWEFKIKKKVKIYSLKQRDKNAVDDIFDKLHTQNRLTWIDRETSFSFSVFVIWRDSSNNRKARIVVDIRDLNAVFQSNAYSLSLQSDIIQIVQECKFIFVIDCASFFYQWRVHSKDRHKFTVVSHREQKTFNVAVMKYRNSSVYVQRQIDRILRSFHFARVYVNDIVVFSKIMNEHLEHLQDVFRILKKNNISINSKKAFFDYSSVTLLDQHVTSFELSTDESKLQTISNLKFPSTLNQLETYLELTEWFRQYIKEFAAISKSLQLRKTQLLQHAFKSRNVRKSYSFRTKFVGFALEIEAFRVIQKSLFISTYLIHFDNKRRLYVDLNSSKEMSIDDVIYHVTSNEDSLTYSFKRSIQSVMFLSRLLSSVETKYWSTKLKLAGLVWIFRKIRHLIDSAVKSTVIYTDHEAFFAIVKQTSLSTSSTNKLNFRLVRASNYIQRFDLIIRHKSDKFHLMSDALSRLFVTSAINTQSKDEKLDIFFTASLMKMISEFRERLIEEYINDFSWRKISKLIESSNKNETILSFITKDQLIYRRDSHNMLFVSERLCISESLVQDILQTTYESSHSGFDKIYQNVVSSYYIKNLSTHIKRYLKHCSKCDTNQTKRHKSYDFLQLILSSSTSFHIIIIDFVLIISSFHIEMNNIMTVTCKFSKRAILISKKKTWKASEWATALLLRLDTSDWDLLKMIISNRDRKFLFELWTKLFQELDVDLLYSTTYHSQTNESSKRTNQILKIALRFHLQSISNIKNWSNTVINSIQRTFNNSISSIEKISNEICYDFISLQSLDLFKNTAVTSTLSRTMIVDAIAMTQMYSKTIYDENHTSLKMQIEDWTLLRLHKRYKISSTIVLKRKLSEQYVESFQILEKIDNLAYKLNISSTWKIWSIIFIAQLESSSTSTSNSFKRTSTSSSFVSMKDESDSNIVRSYEIEKIVVKRNNRRKNHEYLIKWLKYEPQNDFWRSLSKLQNALNLVKKFDDANTINDTIITSRTRERLRKKNNLWICIDRIVNDFFFANSCYTNIL